MTQRTLLEQYAEELMKINEKILHKNVGKKPQGRHFFVPKEWTAEEIKMEKAKVDGLEDEFRGVARLNGDASREHQANVVYRNHWRASIPDDVWRYMMDAVGRAQEKNADEDELWRTYYESRLKICGPGDCHVHVYYTRRGRKARKSFANREDLSEVDCDRDIADGRERVYTCGGRRYYIVGDCYRTVSEEGALSGD